MKKKERAKIDYIILIAVVILVLFGCVMVYSASYYSAFLKQNGDGAYYLKRQVIGVSLGMISMFVLSRVPFTLWKKLHKPIMIGSVLLLVAVFIPGIGISVHDSNRWINLGLFQLQPSEITKLAMIIVFAAHFEKNRHNMDSFKQAVLPVLAVCAIVAGLIILQPNLSTVVCMAAVTFVIMIGAGVKTRHLVWMGLAAVVLVVLAILVAPYRMKRLLVFLDPWKSTSGDSWQLIQSFYAFGSGGLFGKGLGGSQQKLLYLPYGESDFIGAIIAEELGFIGMVLLIALYLVFIWRGIRVAKNCPDRFGSLLALGVTALVAVQTGIHLGVVTGSLPPTGQTLPFISVGITSLLMFLSATGILLNISRYTAKT